MSSGRLGAEDLLAATNTLIYTGPTDTIATVSVNICNRNSDIVAIRLAVLDGAIGTLANEDYIEYDTDLNANGVLERTGLVIAATQTIVAYSDTANVSVQVYGWEEPV
jgi:hypothetical protein